MPGPGPERKHSMTKLFDLTGRVAILTRGNGGLGQGGAAIAIVGRDAPKSAAVVTELKQSGVNAISVIADVTDKAAVDRMVARTQRDFGRVDILVNNAGLNIRKPPHALAPEEWDSVIRTNLTSAFLCSQEIGRAHV